MTIDREAERLADLIIWRLKLKRKDWPYLVAVLAKKLEHAAWQAPCDLQATVKGKQ